MITQLPAVIAADGEALPGAGPDHPMRAVTRQVAFEPGGWTVQRRDKVVALFDGLAAGWHTRRQPGDRSLIADALDRGLAAAPAGSRRSACIEIGSGTGFATSMLAEHFATVMAVDLSIEMLVRAPRSPGHRVLADAATLPVASGSADAAVLVNALLFPAELDRVLAARGVVVWVNTAGAATPIHLPADDVAMALPGRWDGVASTAGHGNWCVVWRSAGER